MRFAIKIWLLLLLAMMLTIDCHSQTVGFDFPKGVTRSRIDFELYNNLIVIPIKINGSIELKFILDTGVQYPILTERFFGDILDLKYSRRIIVQGPGVEDSISAMVATHIDLELPGGVHSGVNQSILVLEDDYLKLRENLGSDIYGIIGYDIFSRFVVEINYDENYLVLHEPRKYRPKKGYKRVPLTISNTKPYMNIVINKHESNAKSIQLMVDTGASHSLLLCNLEDENTFLPSKNIPSVIGRGLAGEIYGHLGRLSTIAVSKFEVQEPIASFPRAGDYGTALAKESRNGTIGGEFLTRFNVTFNYLNGYVYLKKGKNFSKEFEHDMSGMEIAANGLHFDSFKVNSVREDSPAFNAGIKKGDIITSINGYNYEMLRLSGAQAMLRNKEGKKVVVKIQRGEETLKTSFKLLRFI